MREFSPLLDGCDVEMILGGLELLEKKMDADILSKIDEIVTERNDKSNLITLISLFESCEC